MVPFCERLYGSHTHKVTKRREFGDVVLEHDKNSRRFKRAGRQTSAETGGGRLRFWLAYTRMS